MLLNVEALNPQEIANQLDVLYQVKQPALLLGAPGIGKSSVVEQWATSRGFNLVTRMLSQTQPGDLSIPSISDSSKGVLHWNIADWLVELPKDKPTIFFFDELTSASIEVRTQIYQLLLSRQLGGHKLPADSYIIAAGNRASDNASAFDIDTALADRLNIFVMEANPQQWLQWAVKSNIHPAVLTYINTRPDMLMDEDNFEHVCRTSARSWHKVSDVLHVVNNPEKVKILIQGIIGLDATADFIQTLREVRELPDLKMLVNCPADRLAEYAPQTVTGLWGLAYALNAYATSADKLVDATRVMVQLFPLSSVVIKEDVLVAGLNLCLEKLVNKTHKSWIRKVYSNKTFNDVVYPKLVTIPSLAEVSQFLNTESSFNDNEDAVA